MKDAHFSIGEVVRHRMFGYHGVICDVDPVFMASGEWYERVAKSKPPKDRPWYHVLVDGQSAQTYVAERNLEHCESRRIEHPLVELYFAEFKGGNYVPRHLKT